VTDIVWLEGRAATLEAPCVSVFDRGFLYGDSVFEVMRTYGGRVFARGMHLSRLAASAARVGIELPCSLATLDDELSAALRDAEAGELKIRLMITRGGGPLSLDPSTAEQSTRVMILSPLAAHPDALYTDGVSVALVPGGALPGSPAAGAKASNYLANLLAAHEARHRGAHEAILHGPAGELREGATSNVFLVHEGHVLTPRAEAGILEGITRAAVFEAARMCGVALTQTVLFPPDLYAADEAFLTSSLREIVPIVAADGRGLGNGRPGATTKALHQAYRALVSEGAFGAGFVAD